MKTTLILHGHFYQPPREAPDTGIIPKQASAYPSSDWNERITRECYAANAFSRFLSYDGRVRSITNNYEHLSFNFGPTLLHWLRDHDRPTYDRIIAADRESVERLGHGNALAQSFNHTILPLDSPQDARTQIIWGLEDFAFHFGRRAEGIWLPEAGVSVPVIDLLIEQGLSFIILSPWQAEAVETKPGSWKKLKDAHAPYDQPYRVKGSKGELTVFFYNPDLAQGISFGHYLQDADKLYARLLEIKKRESPALLHSATDGEIFGHHEPFGDMCLAALVDKIAGEDEFVLSNYGAYLEANPPKLEAKLRPGELAKGSSWSCFHGVSRWFKDCGCSTGGQPGWNQKWRTPLRRTFEKLSTRLIEIYREQVEELLPGQVPEGLLEDYHEVASGKTEPQEFAGRYVEEPEKQSLLLELLEGQRFRMYTFTSCGWFFADISGIEPVQNLRYAVQAIDLYRRFTPEDLMGILTDGLVAAKSNIEEIGTGREILVSVLPSLKRGLEAASFFVLNRLFALESGHADEYGTYRLDEISFDGRTEFDITYTDIPLARTTSRHVSYVEDSEAGIILHMRSGDGDEAKTVQIRDLPERMVEQMYRWIDDSLARVADNDLERITRDISNYALLIRQGISEPRDEFYITNMGTCLRTLHSLFRQDLPFINRDRLPLVKNLLDFIQIKADERLLQSTNDTICEHVRRHARFICRKFDPDRGRYLREVLTLCRTSGFEPDITWLQNCLFVHLTELREGEETAGTELLALADAAGIVTDDLKKD